MRSYAILALALATGAVAGGSCRVPPAYGSTEASSVDVGKPHGGSGSPTTGSGAAPAGSDVPTSPDTGIPGPEIRSQFPQFNTSLWEKYHCFTFEKLLKIIPPCAEYCETYTIGEPVGAEGFARDGCHPDDFPCHCARSAVISNIIEPCIIPRLNASATCTFADLRPVQAFVTESCTFYNATGYADYHGCSREINRGIIADLRAGTAMKTNTSAQAFHP